MSRIGRLLGREVTEKHRFEMKWINDFKNYADKIFSKSMQEINLDYLDDEDLLLLRDTQKLYKQVIEESENFIHTMNYQIELIEKIDYEMKENKDRLDRIERKLDIK